MLGSSYSFDSNKTSALLCPVSFRCSTVSGSMPRMALMDTGAGICHITYALWRDLGLHKVCFDNNPELFRLMGINSPDEMAFDLLPLISKTTYLGDNSVVKVYEFMMDELILGERDSFNKPITMNGITIRILDSSRASFLIGMNVLRYLHIQYQPSKVASVCRISFDDGGRQLLEHDKMNKKANLLTSNFNYLSDLQIFRK